MRKQRKDEFTYHLADGKGGVFTTTAKSIEEAEAARDFALGCTPVLILLALLIGILI